MDALQVWKEMVPAGSYPTASQYYVHANRMLAMGRWDEALTDFQR